MNSEINEMKIIKKYASYLQQQFWIINKINPVTSAYNIPLIYHIRGKLKHDALERSFNEIVKRHEILRTTYSAENGGLKQIIHTYKYSPLNTVVLNEEKTEGDDVKIAGYIEKEVLKPFNLENETPLRIILCKTGHDDYILVILIHHIATDLRTNNIIIKELKALYYSNLIEKESELKQPMLQYSQFSSWQKEWRESNEFTAMSKFWQKTLEGFSGYLDFPSDKPRSLVQNLNGDEKRFSISYKTSERIKKVAAQEKTDIFLILLSVYVLLLSRYSGQKDIIVGVPFTNRRLEEHKDIAGCLMNILPIAISLKEELTFKDLIKKMRMAMLFAHRHQEIPFELIVHEIHPERASNFNPLFQCGFTFEPPVDLALHGLKVEPVAVNRKASQLDMFAIFWESEHGINGQFEYSSNYISGKTVERFIDNYRTLLNEITSNYKKPIDKIDVLSKKEKNLLLNDWNKTEKNYPLNTCLHRIIEEQAIKTPDQTALVFMGSKLSFGELNKRANQLAHYLQKMGIGPDTPVGICVERSLEMIVGLLGILKAGGAYIPFDPDYPKKRLDFIIDDARVPLILTQIKFKGKLSQSCAKIIYLDNSENSYSDQPTTNPISAAGPDNLAYIIYTSGSTGKPKGAMNTHRAIVNRLLWMQDTFVLTESDCVVQKTPFSFDVSVWEIFWPLMYGTRLIIAEPGGHKDTDYLLDLISGERVTIIHFVPSMLQVFLDSKGLERAETLRDVIASGETLTFDLQNRFFKRMDAKLHNLYGPTEAAVDVTYWKCKKDSKYTVVPIGRPISNIQLYILDENLLPVPIGGKGELYIGGVGLSLGYLNRPELTAEKFIMNPFVDSSDSRLYKTGDLARFLPDGNIEYLDRIDNQVKIRGYRIEPGEIESVLSENPSVRQCVVTVREDVAGDKRLIAYVVEGDSHFSSVDIQEMLKDELPDYMIPSRFIRLDSLPLTNNGKVDRKALPEPEKERPEQEQDYVAPRNENERRMARIWKEVLRIPNAGIFDNFFDLGGDSLLAIQVINRLSTEFKCKVPVARLFRAPAISELTAYIDGIHIKNVYTDIFEENDDSISAVQVYEQESKHDSENVAVIGMSGRFPGANNIEQYWKNLCDGKESITFFSDDELDANIDPGLLENPNYVKAKGILQDADKFDAAFFHIRPREAEVMDPQHRIYLETAWSALEDAGYNPETFKGLIGNFSGMSNNTYFQSNLSTRHDIINTLGQFQIMLANEKDYLATRVSYKLNLKGPSINISTACSTSLVAVCSAFNSLISGQCDLALAGGICISSPLNSGYLFVEGEIPSHDGHCRPFDVNADGPASGNGVGIVVLKRLKEAIQDRDNIYAVIHGCGLNNDGSDKMNFTAPSVNGQIGVIKNAHKNAGILPENVSYVEAHGTATPIGDPIEVEALNQAFGTQESKEKFCGLGSVKSNIGHLDAAAGVAGLIKTVLSLKYKQLPPSINFTNANPNLHLQNSPFFINNRLRSWDCGGKPRVAGVSSFGIGGTNAHVVVGEAPELKSSETPRPWQLLTLSARTANAIERTTDNLIMHMRKHDTINIADAVFTLSIGRRSFSHRRAVVCRDCNDAIDALKTLDPLQVRTAHYNGFKRRIVFMFPGQGSQYVNMAGELYRIEPLFRETIDRISGILADKIDLDIRSLIYPSEKNTELAVEKLNQDAICQPALFAIEYALSRLWMSWGIHPDVMIGHGVGEYTAACISGVMALEDAVELVSIQGQEPAVEPYTASGTMELGSPKIPFISNVTGTWITSKQATDTSYWQTQLHRAARFSEGISTLLEEPDTILLEVGPGNTLSDIAIQQKPDVRRTSIVCSLCHPKSDQSDYAFILKSLGHLWSEGIVVNWEEFYRHEKRMRLSLPTYPFERKRYWVEPAQQKKLVKIDEKVTAREETEKALSDIWSELFGIEQVGIHDDFFELGGDSLLASRMFVKIEKIFNKKIHMSAFFNAPRIDSLTELIEQDRKTYEKAQVPISSPVVRDDRLELSYSQLRLWLLSQIEPDSPAYNMLHPLHIKGKLDIIALEQSLSEIVSRHEVLRTHFEKDDRGPVQVISPVQSIDFKVTDLCHVNVSEQENIIRGLAVEETLKIYDLSKDILVRFQLFQRAEDDNLLCVYVNHIAFDGWSIGIFIRELGILYEAYSSGKSSPLPEIPVQYADYAKWHRDWLYRESMDSQTAYWKKQLSETQVLQLPTDFNRPALPTYRGVTQFFSLSSSQTESLKAMCSIEGVTLFMLLLAVFKVLLHRYSGQGDIAIGVPIANRKLVEAEELIGFFLNMLVIRTDLSDNPGFKELLGRIKKVTFDAYENQDLPFEKLVEALQPVRDMSYHPFYQVMFAFQNYEMQPVVLDTMTIHYTPMNRGISQYDLSMYMWDEDGVLKGGLEYSTDLFEHAAIARTIEHFKNLIDDVLEHPSNGIEQFQFLTEKERNFSLIELNATEADYPHDMCMHQLFEAQAKRLPNATAAIFEGQRLTYRELNCRANQLAGYLKGLGVGPEKLVAIYIGRSLEMLVCILGVHKAGGTYVPLDPAFPHERIGFMIRDSRSTVILTQKRLVDDLPETGAKVVCLDSDWQVISRETTEDVTCKVTGENLAYVIYTSGSTGKPKGLEIAHRALVNFLISMQKEPGLTEKDSLLACTTLSFDISGLELFLPLITGSCTIIVSRETAADGTKLKRALKTSGATVMQATPATWRLLLEAGWKAGKGLKVLCGGEALSRELASRILETGAELWNLYGPTETTIWSTVSLVESGEGPPGIGHPIANTQLYVLDSYLNPVPIGVPGELCIGGEGLSRGYHNNKELTEKSFVSHPFSDKAGERIYKTGDSVCRLSDGSIEFLGRTDQQVKVRGYRIELEEIEFHLNQHPLIRESVVIAREDIPGNKRLVAYCIPVQGSQTLLRELRDFLKKKLPGYMIPVRFVMLEKFPMTLNEKIDRKALPKPEAAQLQPQARYAGPRDEIEKQLVNIWEKGLDAKHISIRDNFFELGGDSLLAARLFAQIEKVTGKNVPLATLFHSPTIEKISEVLHKEHDGISWSPLVPIQEEGYKPPFFLVHGAEGNVLLYRELAHYLGEDQPVYGLQSEGLDGRVDYQPKIETMAINYIQAIRKIQPEGPYYLGGYCLGGTVALEMAQQLQARGQEVALLVMLETYNLKVNKKRVPALIESYNYFQNIYFHILNMLSIDAKGKLKFFTRKLHTEQRRLKDQLDIAFSKLVCKFGIRDCFKYRRLRIDKANDEAHRAYVPKHYAGKIVLFRPEVNYAGYNDPQFGWDKIADRGVDVHIMPVYPRGMVYEPFVKILAGELKECIKSSNETKPDLKAKIYAV